MIHHFMSRQFVSFVLTGGLAACVNLATRIWYSRWVDFSTAVMLAYLSGMVTAFVLVRLFVFRQATQSLRRSLFFFVLVNCVGVLQTWAISMLLYRLLPLAGVTHFVPELAHAIGVAAPVFSSYLGHKKLSFR